MTKAIQFRVLLDYDEDIFRDMELRGDHTFLDLHNMIQEAFGFDNQQMASFYVSNDDWEKGQEITLMDMSETTETGAPIFLMHEHELQSVIFEKSQKLVYVFDFMLMWCFFVDVVSVREIEDNVILPRITQRYGNPPAQYSKAGDLHFEGMELEMYGDAFDPADLDGGHGGHGGPGGHGGHGDSDDDDAFGLGDEFDGEDEFGDMFQSYGEDDQDR